MVRSGRAGCPWFVHVALACVALGACSKSGNTYLPGLDGGASGGATAAGGGGSGAGSCTAASCADSGAVAGAGGDDASGGGASGSSGGAVGGGAAAAGEGGGAGSSGAAGAGGAGGGAGTTSCTPSSVVLMDDLEMPYGYFYLPEPFYQPSGGNWGVYSDQTAPLPSIAYPMQARGEGGQYCAACSGGPFTDWGGGCMVTFGTSIDIAEHGLNGFQFWARSSSAFVLRVNFLDRTSDPNADLCDTLEGCTSNCCYDHYGMDLALGTEWSFHRFAFSELTRENGNGPDLAFDPSWFHEIDFRAPPGVAFEFFLDDLAFLVCP